MTPLIKMPSKIYCDIIIINWNSGNFLNNCINSINENQNKKLISKIYVVDNASTDNSLTGIDSSYDIQIIKNRKNLGFAAACNQGIDASNSKYILFLNPDTELHENTLIDSTIFMENHSDIDVLGIRHTDMGGITKKSCSRFPTLKNYFYDIIGLSKIFPSLFKPATIMSDWDHEDSRFVDQVMGAFMITRRSSIDTFGKFDEQFFVYYEDLDFAHRIWAGGGKVFFLYDIEVYHHGEGTTSKFHSLRLFYSLRSRLLYSSKYFSRTHYASVFFLTVLVEPITRVIFQAIKLNFDEIISILKGYKMLYGHLIKKYL